MLFVLLLMLFGGRGKYVKFFTVERTRVPGTLKLTDLYHRREKTTSVACGTPAERKTVSLRTTP